MTEGQFAVWLQARMEDLDISGADIERATGINASLISKWRRGAALPSLTNLRRLAPALDEQFERIAALAGHLDTVPATTHAPHPLVVDLDRLLPADPADSPLPPEERLLLEALIGRVIDPYRRHLRRRRPR